MVFHKHIPAGILSNYVDCIVYVEGNNKGIGFPKTAMSLVFNLNDSFKLYTDNSFAAFADYKKCWVGGFQTQPSYVESYGVSKMVVIQFRTLGAYHFKNEANDTWEQLKEATSVANMFSIAEDFLYKRLLTSNHPKEKLFKKKAGHL